MVTTDVSLKPYNTFGLDYKAEKLLTLRQEGDVAKVSEYVDNLSLILGGGSNVLLTRDVEGLVVKNELRGIHVEKEDANHIYLRVAAGENWHETVLYAIERGWAGIENLSLIPGCMGAAPMQNIGAYGVELKSVFHSLDAWHLREKRFDTFGAKACRFGYRESIFKNDVKGQYVITSVVLKLSKKPDYHLAYGALRKTVEEQGQPLSLRAVSNAVIAIRQAKLPNPEEIGNAGSFFKNPVLPREQFEALVEQFPQMPSYPAPNGVKVPAGWLIDQAGWKGKTYNRCGVHKNQALVLVNYGGATGRDIHTLSLAIQESIQKRYGIALEREVNLV